MGKKSGPGEKNTCRAHATHKRKILRGFTETHSGFTLPHHQNLLLTGISTGTMAPAPPRNRSTASSVSSSNSSVKSPLHPDSFLNELTAMFERSTEKGSVWVTLKRSSLKSKVQRNKMKTAGEPIEFRCLIRATDGKKTISTSVGAKEHQRFQASYATILKAHMTALKKRERKDRRKTADSDKKQQVSKKTASGAKAS
ncbi:hypothetical protein Ancab_006792 [Ancistrocladus abbreviatus]